MNMDSIPLTRLHPLVKSLFVGTVVVGIAQSMSAPYFAIYLSKHTQIAVATIGFIVGTGALAGTVGGFVGGVISDWLGRKAVLIGSLFVLALANFGYVLSHNQTVILTLIISSGFFGSFFGPTSKALMADVTTAETRMKVFSLQYVGTNIGYAIGPVLGVAFGFLGGATPFVIMACVYLLYVCALIILLGRFPIHTQNSFTIQRNSLRDGLRVMKADYILLIFVLGGLLTTLVHGQWSTPMSVFLSRHFHHGDAIFSALLTTNAIVVILSQPLVSKGMEKLTPIQNVAVGGGLFAFGCVIFALSGTSTSFVLGMVVFTLGEVFMVPSEYVLIDQITPPNMRGAYYGATSLTNLGNFLGPWLFSFLFSRFNGIAMFVAMALCSVLSIFIYWCGCKWRSSQANPVDTADMTL